MFEIHQIYLQAQRDFQASTTWGYIYGSVQDCGIASAPAMETTQSCA